MTSRRKFLTTRAAALTAGTVLAPAKTFAASPKIKWRMQTYAGPALLSMLLSLL